MFVELLDLALYHCACRNEGFLYKLLRAFHISCNQETYYLAQASRGTWPKETKKS